MNLSRRNFLATAGTMAAVVATTPVTAFAGWLEGTKAMSGYPDPSIQVLDNRFNKYRLASASIERLATGFRWTEGPVWFGDGRYLLFSDIPNNRIMKWDEATEAVTVFRQPASYANGGTRDRQGRLVSCEHQTRQVSRTEHDGTITVIANSFDGKRFNSPNDVIAKSDDSIWFTDPRFGHNRFYEGGDKSPYELPVGVYRVDTKTKEVAVVEDDVNGPNGLCFSPDESKLYIVDSLAVPHCRIFVYDVVGNGTRITNKQLFFDFGKSMADGIRCDIDGNLWVGLGGGEGLNGVGIFTPDGTKIGHIHIPERVGNLTFGGAQRNRLYMCGSQSLYSVYTEAQGATIG